MRTFVDLFSGCGGLSLGFRRSGWELVFAVESHRDAFGTYKRNILDRALAGDLWPGWLPKEAHDVTTLIREHRDQIRALAGTIELVVGGPPCQGFSTNGRRRRDDPRNSMVESYLELIALLEPSVVMLENVRGFTSMARDSEATFAEFVRGRLREAEHRRRSLQARRSPRSHW